MYFYFFMYPLSWCSLEMDEAPLVKTAAQQFRKLCYDYRDQLTAGIICAGWDKREGGQVFSIPLGGMCVRQPFAIGGTCIYKSHPFQVRLRVYTYMYLFVYT